jgi:hypothetical protein
MKRVDVQLTITAITAAKLTSGGLPPLMVTDCRNRKTSGTRKKKRKGRESKQELE